MMNKKRAIFFACNERYLFTFCIALLSLKRNSPKALINTDVFLFYQGLDDGDKAIINKIWPCKLVEYKFALPTNFKHINMTKNSQLTFARYEIFDMLNDYSKVLYMDVDIMITGELEYIFENFGDTHGIAMAKDTQKGYTLITKNFIKPMNEYDMTVPCYNAGVTLFCDNIKSRGKLRNWCYEKTVEWLDNIPCPDQAVVNIMIQEFDTGIEILPDRCNCTPSNDIYYDKTVKDILVYHCAGGAVRFWNYGYNSSWEGLYKKYLSLGGGKCPYPTAPFKETFWRKMIKALHLYNCAFFDKAPDPTIHLGRFIRYLTGYPKYYFFNRKKS